MGKVIRFRDGQMIDPDRITGLIKYELFQNNTHVVSVLGIDGNIVLECKDCNEQAQMLTTLSKQLEPYLNPIDLIDLDLSNEIDKNIN